MTGLITVAYFLVKIIFSLILFLLWLRVALRYFQIASLHPISHLVQELTAPLLGPFDRMFPSSTKVKSRYDTVAFVGILIVELVKFMVLGLLIYHVLLPVPYWLLLIVGDLIATPCNLLFYAIIIRVIMSWVNPQWQHPFAEILRLITDPLLNLASRYIPPVAGFDFSPLVIIILLSVISIVVSSLMPLPLL